MSTEYTILSQLLYNDKYARQVLPFLRSSYFHESSEKAIFKTFVEYWQKYNESPTKEALFVELEKRTDLSDSEYEEAVSIVEDHLVKDDPNYEWLVDTTEEWCKDKAVYNAVTEAISIIDGEDKVRTRNAIPDILKEALSISFDQSIGHDYFDNAEDRWSKYHESLSRLSFELEIFDKITNGGVPDKTLNVILAGTNVGKTLMMIHFATTYLKQGKNVLYITLEMSEEEIARRVDANVFNIKINDVEKMKDHQFKRGINKLRERTNGKLIIKQYPTGAGHVGHYRQLLQELKLKKGFKPDAIFVDYIGICASSRMKMGNTSSYFYVKAVAEELRGLAVENDCPLWTAVQATRSGYASNDMDITDTAESFGLPATADFMFGAIRTEELDAINQILIKQMKNRYGNKSYYERFVVGIDPEKNRLFDVERSAQDNVTKDTNDDDGDEKTPSVSRRRRERMARKKEKDFK